MIENEIHVVDKDTFHLCFSIIESEYFYRQKYEIIKKLIAKKDFNSKFLNERALKNLEANYKKDVFNNWEALKDENSKVIEDALDLWLNKDFDKWPEEIILTKKFYSSVLLLEYSLYKKYHICIYGDKIINTENDEKRVKIWNELFEFLDNAENSFSETKDLDFLFK